MSEDDELNRRLLGAFGVEFKTGNKSSDSVAMGATEANLKTTPEPAIADASWLFVDSVGALRVVGLVTPARRPGGLHGDMRGIGGHHELDDDRGACLIELPLNVAERLMRGEAVTVRIQPPEQLHVPRSSRGRAIEAVGLHPSYFMEVDDAALHRPHQEYLDRGTAPSVLSLEEAAALIRKTRVDLGLDRAELGRRLGVSAQTVWRYESGETKDIPPSIIAKLGMLHDGSAVSVAAERYRLLVVQMADELQRERGYKAEIARRLGIHPFYVTRVERGGQSVSERTIDDACRRLYLRRDFFTDESLSDPSYRDWIGPDRDAKGDEDPEGQIITSLAALSDDARARVIDYAVRRWGGS